jgi:hypothetical protein
MTALTSDQIELLQRAHDGPPLWGGSIATPRLRRDVDLLVAMQLIEAAEGWPYRLTRRGEDVFEAERVHGADGRRAGPA